MLLDSQTLFSQNQSLVLGTGTTISTNVIDLTNARDLGVDAEIQFLALITASLTSGGAATLAVQLVAADNAALTTNPIDLYSTDAVGYATLTAGYVMAQAKVPILRGLINQAKTKRYLGVNYVVAGAAITGGTITSALTRDVGHNITYPSGLNVSGF